MVCPAAQQPLRSAGDPGGGLQSLAANATNISVAGGPAASTSSDALEEVSLDVEWASSLAPGAQIRIYGASEDDPAENDEILQQAADAILPN